MQKTLKGLPPGTVLAGTLILSALPLVAVEIFPGQLKFVMTPASYAVFHNIAEFFSVMVSLSMFGVGWYTYDQSKDRHALFLSVAFLAIGMMDFMHALSQVSMPAFFTPNSSNKASQFWIAARLFQAAAFLMSAYVYAETPSRWLSKRVLMTSALLLPFLVFTGIIFSPAYVPATFVPGVGVTPFKKISEYVVVGLLCAAAAAYWQRMARTGDRLCIYYPAAFVICIFSELPLAVYTKVFDTYNVLGHIYKVAAFFLIYYGIYKASVKAPYLRLTEVGEKLKGEIAERKRTEEALHQAHNHLEVRVEERTVELAQSNAQLRAEIEDRRKAEEALRETHERSVWLARFPEENPNPIVRVSTDGTVLYCNPSSVELHGWACVVGQPLDHRLLPLASGAMAEGEEWQQDVEIGRRVFSVWVAPFPGEGYANIYGRDITERKHAEQALQQRSLELQQLTETLEQRVQERTAELERANEALRDLSSRLLSAHEEERKKIAGEIHDVIGACLGAIKFKVEGALQQIGETPLATTESLRFIMPVIQEGIEECRRIQMDLRPSLLDDLGLLPTLSWFCRRFQTIYSAIQIKQEIGIEEVEIPNALKIVIYRVTQEAMNNIAKHSKANRVRLSLQKSDDRMELILQDNGRGFDPAKVLRSESARQGLGLTNMRERVELSGGSLDIKSVEGKGTVIRASWPI